MTTWMKWAWGDKPFQNFVLRWIECSFWVSVQWVAITIVDWIVYYSFHSVFLSSRMCWIVLLLHRIRRIEETWERSESCFRETFWHKLIYLFVHLIWSFRHHSRLFKGFLVFIYIWWIYSRIFFFFLLAFSSHINNVFSASCSLLNCL